MEATSGAQEISREERTTNNNERCLIAFVFDDVSILQSWHTILRVISTKLLFESCLSIDKEDA
jgi:hypothetical protein